MKTKVVHSQTKSAWNVIGTIPGNKYKIARVPYFTDSRMTELYNQKQREDAYKLAFFISISLENYG